MADELLCVDLEDELEGEGVFVVEVEDDVEEVSGVGDLDLLVFDLEDLVCEGLAEIALDELFEEEEVGVEEVLDIDSRIDLLEYF